MFQRINNVARHFGIKWPPPPTGFVPNEASEKVVILVVRWKGAADELSYGKVLRDQIQYGDWAEGTTCELIPVTSHGAGFGSESDDLCEDSDD